MSFIGPRLFIQIDSRLNEAFPEKKSVPLGERSMILVGDLGQLPPVKDKPLYIGTRPVGFCGNISERLLHWTQYFVNKGQIQSNSILKGC